jgi:hypothetical protein
MKHLLAGTACLLFFSVEAAHAVLICQYGRDPDSPAHCMTFEKYQQMQLERQRQDQQIVQQQKEAQTRQILLEQQKRNPLLCRFILREGAGWCRATPSGLPTYVVGGPCRCGSFKTRFDETVLEPPGTLANGPAPTNASGGFEYFARFGCDNLAKAGRGLC